MKDGVYFYCRGEVDDTPGLALSPQLPLLDWPLNTGPSAGTVIVATPCLFLFLFIFPCRPLLCHSLVTERAQLVQRSL